MAGTEQETRTCPKADTTSHESGTTLSSIQPIGIGFHFILATPTQWTRGSVGQSLRRWTRPELKR